MASSTSSLPQSFISKKRKILEQLAVPVSEYDDLSPKGSVDEGIRDLIDEINQIEGCVTTSSCAGRVSIFLEGKKDVSSDDSEEVNEEKEDREPRTRAGVGGKGGGGKWLYVSHDPMDWRDHENRLAEFFGMRRKIKELEHALVPDVPGWERWVHFKFEPMILHILTASLQQSQIVLAAALQSGFRESGAINLISLNHEPPAPMVAVRSMGLSLESIVGCGRGGINVPDCIVPEETLQCLVGIANERFVENTQRIDRFRRLLKKLSIEESGDARRKGQEGEEWENPQARKERKRAEGLWRSQQMKQRRVVERQDDMEIVDVQLLNQDT